MSLSGYTRDCCFIPAHHQPAALIDLALARDIDETRLLRGTRLPADAVRSHELRISPRQFLALAVNAERLLGTADTAFLFGERLLPGHYGSASLALQQAGNLQQALDLLCECRAVLSPMLVPRVFYSDDHVYLYWLDGVGCGEQRRFFVEAGMRALLGMAHWLGAERLPWRVELSRAAPLHTEHYWAHLGPDVIFGASADLVRLPREWLLHPWPRAASATVARGVHGAARSQCAPLGQSLIETAYDVLYRDAADPPGLDMLAARFAMSSATFKRRLAEHGTHYQALLDLARKHVAIYLYRACEYSHPQVARYLRFNDEANFRRSFKRWTGCTPSAFLGGVLAGEAG
jgi:AraC-like DNA-binding protein